MKHPGDPTPKSASAVLADRNYKMVVVEQSSQTNGQVTIALVVLHCGTETHWTTSYPASQATAPMTWQQVEPVVETRIIYRPVS